MRLALLIALLSTLAVTWMVLHPPRTAVVVVPKVNPQLTYNGWKLAPDGAVVPPPEPDDQADVSVPVTDAGAAK